MSIPIGLILFFLGLMISLVTYIWTAHSKRLDKLERLVSAADLSKCQECEPVTVSQITALFDARFNEFRLELYKSGVLKAPTNRSQKK
ncbi:MAG TPA: hypothetical protein PL188_11165 [Candidatus Cloacimonadota bacterium]|nr:hypothetical protein [Candidatus Cloacimonadota bacterium]